MAKRHGFPRAERVTRTQDFDRIFQEGERRGGRFLSVCLLANGLPYPRLGIAMGRGWKGGVRRNRAKRLIREAFRTHKDALPPGLDIVVIPGRGWSDPRVDDIASELIRLAHRPR